MLEQLLNLFLAAREAVGARGPVVYISIWLTVILCGLTVWGAGLRLVSNLADTNYSAIIQNGRGFRTTGSSVIQAGILVMLVLLSLISLAVLFPASAVQVAASSLAVSVAAFTLRLRRDLVGRHRSLYAGLKFNPPSMTEALNWPVYRVVVEPYTRSLLVTAALAGGTLSLITGVLYTSQVSILLLLYTVFIHLIVGHVGGLWTIDYFSRNARMWGRGVPFRVRLPVYLPIGVPVVMAGGLIGYMVAGVLNSWVGSLEAMPVVFVDFAGLFAWCTAPLVVNFCLPPVGSETGGKRRIFSRLIGIASLGSMAILAIAYVVLT